MLEYLNAAACALLLAYCLPVAAIMQAQHRWPLWMLFVIVVLCLTVQVIDPFSTWIPSVGWPGVLLNIAMALTVTLWRKEAWLFMRCRMGPPVEQVHPLRRVSDLSPRNLTHMDGLRVNGRGKA
jgi:K+ transporter